MQNWEYIVVHISNPETTQEKLNLYGSQGWELVAVDAGDFYFKRPRK